MKQFPLLSLMVQVYSSLSMFKWQPHETSSDAGECSKLISNYSILFIIFREFSHSLISLVNWKSNIAIIEYQERRKQRKNTNKTTNNPRINGKITLIISFIAWTSDSICMQWENIYTFAWWNREMRETTLIISYQFFSIAGVNVFFYLDYLPLHHSSHQNQNDSIVNIIILHSNSCWWRAHIPGNYH